MSDILRQIDEDLRKDRLSILWKRYGVYLIIILVIIILSVIGYQLKVTNDKSKNEKLVETYLDASNYTDKENVIDSLNKIINSNSDYLSGIVELKKSNLFIEDGKLIKGIEALENIIENNKYDPVINDLATYYLLMMKIEDPDDTAFLNYLNDDKIEKSKFKYLFLEMVAIRQLMHGNFTEAKINFKKLINFTDLPIEIRNRASKYIELAEKND